MLGPRAIRRTVLGVSALTALLTLASIARPGPVLAQGEIIVTNNGRITVHSRADGGNAAPLRAIEGPISTTFDEEPSGLAVSVAHGEMLVGFIGDDTVKTFPLGASGDPAATRVITEAPGLNLTGIGVAYDPVNDELFVANHGTPSSIYVYARTATGGATPLRVLAGPTTGIHQPFQIVVDPVNNEFWVTNRLPPISVRVFSRTASGDAAPLRVIEGPATGLSFPQGIAVDLVHDEILIADGGVSDGRIQVFPRLANGNQAPLRTIQGPSTGLSLPRSVALDPATDELFVANQANHSIAVFSRTASGNAPPLRTIAGPATGLDSPAQLAITSGPPLPPTTLVAAVLPNAFAVQVGGPLPASAFVTVINTGPNPARQVGIALTTAVPAGFSYQTTNAANVLVGNPNTPVDIAVGGSQTFAIFITPTAAFGPTELTFSFAGSNTAPVAVLVGINTFLLLASATPTPNMLALAATAPNDGIVRIPGVAGTGVFVVATSNLGIGDTITVTADTGAAAVPVTVLMCQTDPITGACLSALVPTLSVPVAAGATPTFGFFVSGTGVAIPLDPAVNRVFIRLHRSDGLIVGGTSVAVMTL